MACSASIVRLIVISVCASRLASASSDQQLTSSTLARACGGIVERDLRPDNETLNTCLAILSDAFGFGKTLKEAEEKVTETCVGAMRGLGTIVSYTDSTRSVCWGTPTSAVSITSLACETMSTLAWEFLAMALSFLLACSSMDAGFSAEVVETWATSLFGRTGDLLQDEADLHALSPLGEIVSSKLVEFRRDFLSPLQPSSHTRQIVMRLFSLNRKICEYANWIIWRDVHYLWLMDSLRLGQVTHTSWGPIERWDELGANDARAVHPLENSRVAQPAFVFNPEDAQWSRRRDVLVGLLRRLHEDLGAPERIVVVEVGVFRAELSRFVLEKLPFVQLVGVDPYIGSDGTFPGDFSQTLPPSAAFEAAAEVFQNFGDRAVLYRQTSEEAAQQISDGSVDAVFVDGCHLYECVDADLRAWTPKLRGKGALVAGHDFSPQWPGVVRAVYEHRRAGRKVNLGMDWTYWWYVE